MVIAASRLGDSVMSDAGSGMPPVSGILALNLVLFGSQLPAVLDRATSDLAFHEAMLAVLAVMSGTATPSNEAICFLSLSSRVSATLMVSIFC